MSRPYGRSCPQHLLYFLPLPHGHLASSEGPRRGTASWIVCPARPSRAQTVSLSTRVSLAVARMPTPSWTCSITETAFDSGIFVPLAFGELRPATPASEELNPIAAVDLADGEVAFPAHAARIRSMKVKELLEKAAARGRARALRASGRPEPAEGGIHVYVTGMLRRQRGKKL